MKSNYIPYNFEESKNRINSILNTSDKSFKKVDVIPARHDLTLNNGFYIDNITALFIDIRKSSELPSKYTKTILAIIYRSYISEVVAIINGNIDCAEININGDCVWGVFNAKYQIQIDRLFLTASKISSIVDTLNCKYGKKGIEPIIVGIGISIGKVLMIKAGDSNSRINEIVWMGDVVNESSNLCSYGNRNTNDKEIMVSKSFRDNLNNHDRRLLEWNEERSCYHGNLIDLSIMSEKYK